MLKIAAAWVLTLATAAWAATSATEPADAVGGGVPVSSEGGAATAPAGMVEGGTSTAPVVAAGESTGSMKPAFERNGKPVVTEINAGKMVTYGSPWPDGQGISAYLVTPKLPAGKTGAVPAVIVVPDIFGMTQFIKEQADGLAKQGYVVLVPDLYSRLGENGQNLDAHGAWAAYDRTSDEQVRKDLSAAIDYLQDADKGLGKIVSDQPVGMVGYDMGGIYSMMMAGTDLRVNAAVNYYGRVMYPNISEARPVSPVDMLFNVHAPLLSFYGTNDPQVPGDHVRALDARLGHNPNKVYYEIVRVQGVGHGFMTPGRQGYDKKAAEDAGAKVRDFLARNLRGAPSEAAE